MKRFNKITNYLFIVFTTTMLIIIISSFFVKGITGLGIVGLVVDLGLGLWSIYDLRKGEK